MMWTVSVTLAAVVCEFSGALIHTIITVIHTGGICVAGIVAYSGVIPQ